MKIVLAASVISATAAALVVAKSTLRRRKAIVLAASPRQNVLDTPGVSIIHRGSSLATSNPDEFSILSFNVLADKYLRGKLVPGVPPEYLQWEHRSKLLDEELGASNADIICLQEVEPNRWEEVCALPSLAGYTCLLKDRQKDKEARAIALAIFFKAPRFELLWTESRSRVLLAALRFKDSYGLDQVLYLMNLHLEGSPHRPHDRLSQMRSALQRLQQCQQEQQKLGGPPPEDCTTAIVGDFKPALTQMVTQLLAFKPEQRPDTNALLRNPTLVAKARQLGVDMKPKLSVSSEDKPMYAASQPQQQPPSQGQYNEQYHEGGEAQLQRPSGNTYLKYPPYNNNFSPDAQHPAQQQAPPNRRPPIGGSYANYPPYNNASPSPRPQPGYEAPPPQQGGYQRPASANARTAGQRPGAAAHPFDLPGGRGGGANQQANHPSYPDRREQMATHHAWPADPRTPAVDQRGPMQPYAVHEGANDNYDRMADEIERMALGTADFKRAQAERDAANRANAARGQRDEIRDVMQGGGPNTPSRNQQYRVRPEEMPAAGGRNKLNDGVPFAQHSSGLGTMSMAQQQNAEAWNVNYSPPQYGRKRNNDLMATGPQMRGGDGSGHRPGTANAWAPRAADDATSYMSSHTSYYR